jgi:uncharacterized Tic20 family protein
MNDQENTPNAGGESPQPSASSTPAPSPEGGKPSKQETQWAMFTHLAAFAGVIIPYAGNVIGPLVMWLIKKDEMPFADDQGKEAINFQISMVIYGLVALVLCFVFIGFLLLPVVVIIDVIFTIVATIKASDGIAYRYPMSIRFIK